MVKKKFKLTFVIPEKLQKDFKLQIIKDGYDMKAKSRWMAESIEKLLAMNNYPDLVKINDEMTGFEKFESVVITMDLKKKLDSAIVAIRRSYPTIEGVQSRILRTSIVQRLLLT